MKDNAEASAHDIAEVVVNQQMASALKSHEKIHIFLRAIISSPEEFKNKAIENNSETIEKITQKNPIMERHLISAAEDICSGDILDPKFFPVMLKQLFDEDVLAEMVILGEQNYKSCSGIKVGNKCLSLNFPTNFIQKLWKLKKSYVFIPWKLL